MGEPHTRPQAYLFFYHDPLKEKGEAADIKKKNQNQDPNKNLQMLGKGFKKSRSSVCFSFYRPPSKFTQG